MVVDLNEAYEQIESYWDPHVAGELNGQHVKLARVEGEFDWHHHEESDELFFVHEGELTIRFRDRDDVTLTPGQFHVVSAGVEHQPVAESECRIMLFEPAETLNTGNIESEKTVREEKRIE